MKRLVVLGGGIIGSMHAFFGLKAGFEVIQVERDSEALSASVRNFGLIWVSGREAGPELDLALRARVLWQEVGTAANIGFRGNGSLTIARTDAEFGVLQEAASMEDAMLRGFEILHKREVQQLEPILAGNFVGALRCSLDGAVEPSMLFSGLRAYLLAQPHYQWIPNFEAVAFDHNETGNHISDAQGVTISGEYMALCPGAAHAGFLSDYLQDAPLRKVFLQMGSTKPITDKLSHSIADSDSLRYYPAFKNLSLDRLPPQSEVAVEHKMQLLLTPRFDGSFTIGDTHLYQEPFSHEIVEEPYLHLLEVIGSIFGREFSVAKRWSGVYSQSTSTRDIYYRNEIAPGAVIVTGGGGRGNTLSPAIAEETITSWAK
jgi:FAD dependent oxidoreductase TIGR03364